MKIRLCAAAIVCVLAGSAQAQYALDRSLQVGSGGKNAPGRDFKAEMEFRNAIVTGNAPGGISFRGDVGYRAPGEFFGRLGSNETFSFRRDSAYSGLGGLGIRGTDALQYQFAVTTGNAVPAGISGIPLYGRSGSAPGINGRVEGFKDIERPKQGDYGYDNRGLSLMSVRSPSAYVANRGLQPTVLGRGDVGAEPKAITASMLRGVAYDDIGVLRANKDDKKDEKRPESAAPSTALPTGVSTTTTTTVASTELPTAYQDLMERLRKNGAKGADGKGEDGKGGDGKTPDGAPGSDKPGADKADAIPEWQRRLTDLRDHLRDNARPAAKKPAATPKPDGTGRPEAPVKPDQPSGQGEDPDSSKPAPKRDPLSTDTVEILKRAGEKISALAPPSFDPYGTQMTAGQEKLAAGRYFDAEERFTAALSAKPGDPMAMVGRIHSQLGAGMFLSAAINLRGLLTEHPELVTTRYGESLLPIGQRKGKVLERLEELVSEPGGRGRDPGLLMAYMGFQTGDGAAMKRGLAAMNAGGPAEPDQLAKLADLLGRVWTEEAAKPAPTTPPSAPPAPAPEQPK